MKKYSRRIASLALAVILMLSTLAFSGCYVISSGTIKQVSGTYKLTKYTDKVDRLETDGIELYLVLSSGSTGYFAYRDNETAGYTRTVSIRYIEDTEEPGKYSYVEVDFEGKGEYEKFGIYCKLFERKLNATRTKWKGNPFEGTLQVDYTISIGFERVSSATDLSYVNKHFG